MVRFVFALRTDPASENKMYIYIELRVDYSMDLQKIAQHCLFVYYRSVTRIDTLSLSLFIILNKNVLAYCTLHYIAT